MAAEAPKYVLVALTTHERDVIVNALLDAAPRMSPKPDVAALIVKLEAPPATSLPTGVIQNLIVTRLVRDLLAAGYNIEVYDADNDELNLPPSQDFATIMGSIFDPEIDAVDYMLNISRINKDDVPATDEPDRVGWVRLIDGNGTTVISDYTANLDAILEPINQFCDTLDGLDT